MVVWDERTGFIVILKSKLVVSITSCVDNKDPSSPLPPLYFFNLLLPSILTYFQPTFTLSYALQPQDQSDEYIEAIPGKIVLAAIKLGSS